MNNNRSLRPSTQPVLKMMLQRLPAPASTSLAKLGDKLAAHQQDLSNAKSVCRLTIGAPCDDVNLTTRLLVSAIFSLLPFEMRFSSISEPAVGQKMILEVRTHTAAAPVDTLRPPSLATESWLEYGRRPTPNLAARCSGPAVTVAMKPRELCGRVKLTREPQFQRALRAPQPSTLYSCRRDCAAIFIASSNNADLQRSLCICCRERLCALHQGTELKICLSLGLPSGQRGFALHALRRRRTLRSALLPINRALQDAQQCRCAYMRLPARALHVC